MAISHKVVLTVETHHHSVW